VTEESPEPAKPTEPTEPSDSTEPKRASRPGRARRARLEPDALGGPESAAQPAIEPSATAAAADPDELPAVPHPALMPARPGTPPPPPGPPGTYVEPRPVRPRSNSQLTFGIVLVVLGVLFLLNEFGLLWWVDGRLIWPVVLIAGGLLLLYRRGRA
jgi:hypothetical protein